MTSENSIENNLNILKNILNEAEKYYHASRVLSFDMQTVCPEKAMEKESSLASFLSNIGFKLTKSKKFIQTLLALYEQRGKLSAWNKTLIEGLYREYSRNKNITPAMNRKFSETFDKAFLSWLQAKKETDFSIFAKDLSEVRKVNWIQIQKMENRNKNPYNNLLAIYERGITVKDLDFCFDACKERLIPLLKKIQNSPKKIRTDFLSRKVSEENQQKMTELLLDIMQFDFLRGNFSKSEHPFTSGIAENDARITTHYYEDNFCSNIFSILHEGGHALFEQGQPATNFKYHIETFKTLGQHESVSRFYENRIGRSKSFIHLIYPKAKTLFPEVFSDVSEREFYEAVNMVAPSFIRTEADEFTYTFHIIIRYEIEKLLVNDKIEIRNLPEIWNQKYEEYLGITPKNDREGILQDVHWTSGFGYFPTYALGNFYNSMYYLKMQESFNIEEAVLNQDFKKINSWMQENVFQFADRLDAKTWIKKITSQNFSPDAFLDYIENKYSKIYLL